MHLRCIPNWQAVDSLTKVFSFRDGVCKGNGSSKSATFNGRRRVLHVPAAAQYTNSTVSCFVQDFPVEVKLCEIFYFNYC